MAEPRLRRVSSVFELDAAVEEYLARGFRVADRDDKKVLVRKDDPAYYWYHLCIAVTMGWWTFGVANAIYAKWYRDHVEQVLVTLAHPKS